MGFTNAPGAVSYRAATAADASGMAACRATDPAAGQADPRMAAYFSGQHHPQRALAPRTGFVALAGGVVVGYIAGHLSTRYGCAAEVQYLYVAPAYRRRGVATALLRLMAGWFRKNSARRVCVNVDLGSPAAKPFYESLGAAPLSPHRRYWHIWDDITRLTGSGPDR